MTRVILTDEARADAGAAFAFYEERRTGLGDHFREHVDLAITRVQRSPQTYRVVYRDLRRKLVDRFPYAILYRLYPDLVVVVAIMHVRRDPAAWQRRARRSEPG